MELPEAWFAQTLEKTFQKQNSPILLAVLGDEDDYVDVSMLIFNKNYQLSLITQYIIAIIITSFRVNVCVYLFILFLFYLYISLPNLLLIYFH